MPPFLRRSVVVNDREYQWPREPLVVVCLDGSSLDYIEAAASAGAAPFLGASIAAGRIRRVRAAMPSFTNPNNVSIVTGVPPARHGICGNFFLDRATGRAVMMNDASFLRADTVPAAFSRAGARVAVVTAKDKLTRLLGAGLQGVCVSAEAEGQPVYSSALSEHVLRRGVALLAAERPDLLYLSTSDYVQHAHPPGSPVANRFFAAMDNELERIDRLGAALVVTADHGMRAKTDASGAPRIVFLQTLLDGGFGSGETTVILPITDPYVAHHGSLGSFATVYLSDCSDAPKVANAIASQGGVETVLTREVACDRFELPPDRIGELVVCADAETVLGTRPEDHDLSLLAGPLRSHGGLAEREVPMLFNRPLASDAAPVNNYDAFWIGLNLLED